jgi:hypothetical protein
MVRWRSFLRKVISPIKSAILLTFLLRGNGIT